MAFRRSRPLSLTGRAISPLPLSCITTTASFHRSFSSWSPSVSESTSPAFKRAGILGAGLLASGLTIHTVTAEEKTETAATGTESDDHFPNVVLYQFACSPYVQRVRTFLDYNNLPYSTVEVNPITKSQIKFSSYKKVPIVMFSGEQLNDSLLIINTITKRLEDRGFIVPSPPLDTAHTETLGKIENDLMPVYCANRYQTFGDTFQAFAPLTNSEEFIFVTRWLNRILATIFVYFSQIKNVNKIKAISEENNVRKELYKQLDNILSTKGNNAFFGGTKPNTVDFVLYGTFRSSETDNFFSDILAHSLTFRLWYLAMQREITLQSSTSVWKVAMKCNGCANSVRNALSAVPGVDTTHINLPTKTVIVRGVTADAVDKILTEANREHKQIVPL